jgi:predicted permease
MNGWRRLAWWFDGSRRDREIADEMRSHLQMATERHLSAGAAPDEARRLAEQDFGNLAQIRQATREIWTWAWLEHLLQDVKFGARILWHAPALSLTAVVLIALVVGGNTTVYSIVRMLLTSPAAGVSTEGLLAVSQVRPTSDEPFVSYPNFLDLAGEPLAARGAAGWSAERLTVAVGGISYAVFGGLVTEGFFETFGVGARLGETLGSSHASVPGGLAAVVSERFWKDKLGESPNVLGRPLTVNGQPATIVGVAANGFRGATLTPGEDIWLPLAPYYRAIGSEPALADRAQPLVLVAVRAPAEMTRRAVQARLDTLAARLVSAYPQTNTDHRFVVSDYSSTALLPLQRMSGPFIALMGVITFLTLVVVAANVANLMLVRALARQREIAVRQSMGASRGRVVRLLVTEGATVSAVAWLLASGVAWGLSRALVRLVGPSGSSAMAAFTPDWRVAGYAMILAIAATVAFTTAPALRAWRQPVLPWLRAGEPSVAHGRSRVTSALVVTQIAFSVVLLTSAGLVYRSVALLESRAPGFDPQRLLLVTLRASERGAFVDRAVTADERIAGFARLERLRERVLADGRLEAATYVRRVPGAYLNVGVPIQRPDAPPISAIRRPVGPGYLGVLGLTPLAGRDILASDRRGGPRIAVVNEHLAQALWPGLSAIGRTLTVGESEPAEIVGVAPNAFFDGPSHDPHPRYVFVAEQQSDGDPPIDPSLMIRYRGSLAEAVGAAGEAIGDVDATVPIVASETMANRLALVTELERTVSGMLAAFAVLSLVVASIGLYAIAAFNMRRRTRDFGIRLALGATPRQVRAAVVQEGVRLAGLGLVLGCAVSAGVAAAIGGSWLGVTPTDPPTYSGVVLVLAATSLLASAVPAWHAARVDVVDALRQE